MPIWGYLSGTELHTALTPSSTTPRRVEDTLYTLKVSWNPLLYLQALGQELSPHFTKKRFQSSLMGCKFIQQFIHSTDRADAPLIYILYSWDEGSVPLSDSNPLLGGCPTPSPLLLFVLSSGKYVFLWVGHLTPYNTMLPNVKAWSFPPRPPLIHIDRLRLLLLLSISSIRSKKA
jgi:hypothetical protein